MKTGEPLNLSFISLRVNWNRGELFLILPTIPSLFTYCYSLLVVFWFVIFPIARLGFSRSQTQSATSRSLVVGKMKLVCIGWCGTYASAIHQRSPLVCMVMSTRARLMRMLILDTATGLTKRMRKPMLPENPSTISVSPPNRMAPWSCVEN